MAKSKNKGNKKKGGGGKNSQGWFLDPLTKRKAKKQAKVAGRLATQPERRQIQGEQRASQLQSKRISSWFPQYGAEVDKAGARTASAYGQAATSIGQTRDTASQYAETLRQRLAGEEQADAARRGASYDPSGSQTNAAAQLARINSANVLQGVTQAQGAAQGAYYADKKRIGEREKVEQLLREEKRRQSFDADLRALARTKGDTQRQELSGMRESEREFHLGQQAAQSTKRGQRITAQNSRRSAATTRRGQDMTAANAAAGRAVTRRGQNISRGNSKRSAAGGGGGGKEPVDNTHIQQMIATLRLTNSNKLKKWSKKETMARLMGESQTYTAAEARKALKKFSGGGKKKKKGKKIWTPYDAI